MVNSHFAPQLYLVIIIIIIIQSVTLCKASRHHFNQSLKQTRVFAFPGSRHDRISLMIYPVELKSLSHGTDVAGTQRIVCSKLPRLGKRWLLSFHHIKVSASEPNKLPHPAEICGKSHLLSADGHCDGFSSVQTCELCLKCPIKCRHFAERGDESSN